MVHNQDNREHDLLDSDDYYQFEGGLTVAVRSLSGVQPAVYHNDHSRPERPRIHTLEEEIARVVRARVVNPKWIAGVMRHGYKGAFEMAATVDYMFAFAATAHAVRDHHFAGAVAAYMKRPGLTQSALSRRTGIPQPNISGMLAGKRWLERKALDTLAKECRIVIRR